MSSNLMQHDRTLSKIGMREGGPHSNTRSPKEISVLIYWALIAVHQPLPSKVRVAKNDVDANLNYVKIRV